MSIDYDASSQKIMMFYTVMDRITRKMTIQYNDIKWNEVSWNISM